MITKSSQRRIDTETGTGNSTGILKLERLFDDSNMPKHLRTYSRARLEPGACVGFHMHHGEAESYYILSGQGEYDDDGKKYNVEAGDLTYTPDGHGHGIKNIGSDVLEFIALIIYTE